MSLHAITHRSWIAEHLGARHHHGFDLVDVDEFVPGVDAIWTPGHYASLYWMSGSDWRFADVHWWELDGDILGRRVRWSVDSELPILELLGGPKFVKLARHKYDYFQARVRTLEEFLDDIQVRPWSKKHEYIVSDPLEIATEYRVFCPPGRDPIGRTYRAGEWFWGDDDDNDPRARPAPDKVLEFAQEIAPLLPGSPALDIAELASGRLVLIEANPAWCSGFYDLPRDHIVAAVKASQGWTAGDVPVRFIPDTGVRHMLDKHPILRALH